MNTDAAFQLKDYQIMEIPMLVDTVYNYIIVLQYIYLYYSRLSEIRKGFDRSFCGL